MNAKNIFLTGFLAVSLAVPMQAAAWSLDFSKLGATVSSWKDKALQQANSVLGTGNEKDTNLSKDIVACMESDAQKLLEDSRVTKAFEREFGVSVTYPKGTTGKFLGSGDIMSGNTNGLNCDLKKPSNTVAAYGDPAFDPKQSVALFTSAPVAVFKKKAHAEIIAAHYGVQPEELTFSQIMNAAGKQWSELGSKKRGIFKVHATDQTTSGSSQIALFSALYESGYDATGEYGVLDENTFNSDAVQKTIAAFRDGVERSETSTGTLTGKFLADRAGFKYTAIFTYESKIPSILKVAPNAFVVRSFANVMADHPVIITTQDAKRSAAAKAFIKFLLRPEIQKIAMEYNFRPAIAIPASGAVAEWEALDFGVVDPPNGDIVSSVLSSL